VREPCLLGRASFELKHGFRVLALVALGTVWGMLATHPGLAVYASALGLFSWSKLEQEVEL